MFIKNNMIDYNKACDMHPVTAIRHGKISVDSSPIIYYWWFKESSVKILLRKLHDYILWNELSFKNVNGQKYVLLYVGKGKNGKARLADYHILDKSNFHKTGIANSRISSLRASICGLLDITMSSGKNDVDKFIDENCLVNWTVEKGDLKTAELISIESNYLPLNDHHLNSIYAKEHRKIIRDCKKNMRK